MKASGACHCSCFWSAARCRPPPNVARVYRDFGTALRLSEKGKIKKANYDGSSTWGSRRFSSSRPRCFGTLSVAPELAERDNANLIRHGNGTRWPRLTKTGIDVKSCREFNERYRGVYRGQTAPDEVQVRGRIWGFRVAGNKLAFIDLMQDNTKLQIVCNYRDLDQDEVGPEIFKNFVDGLKRGDIISAVGHPHRTTRNELSLLISEIPLLLSSCVRPLPREIKNEESRMRLRHVDLLIRPQAAQLLKLGSEIKSFLRTFLEEQGHLSVKTPILASAAGGAIAKPFHTRGFEARRMALRIAPELWLKRLIIGGFERIYEIGPSFRNEGIDLSHNPEFETCEFYRTYADLEELIETTEKMFHRMAIAVNVLEYVDLAPPYDRLDFTQAIEAEMGRELPKLDSPDLNPAPILIEMMRERSIKVPEHPTLPHLLDRLSSHYLEPQCQRPTWIVNPPECLSPLSKSFPHRTTGQMVAARAELFVHGQEIVNTYEEENSPIEQREKFIRQLKYNKTTSINEELDESYLEALEYGMPPTGGWGCGIERLTMLFGGTKRIADTLAFGTLKNVVALGSNRKTTSASKGNKLLATVENESSGSRERNSEDGESRRDLNNTPSPTLSTTEGSGAEDSSSSSSAGAESSSF